MATSTKPAGQPGAFAGWLALLLVTHACLLAFQAYRDSPTLDEVGHLPAGLCHLMTGDMSLYCVNPPLVRSVAAIPVALMRPQTDWKGMRTNPLSRWEFDIGRRFCELNGERTPWLFTAARLICIPFSLLGAVIVAMWSREWFGNTAGLLTAALWSFSPNILTHGHLMTPDVAATAFGAAACYVFTHWIRSPSWRRTLLLGISISLALLCKSIWIVLPGILWLQWFLLRMIGCRDYSGLDWRNAPKLFVVVPVVVLLGTNHFYGWQGSFKTLGDYQFVSESLGADGRWEPANRFADTWIAALPVPLPESFVQGIDFQKRDFEAGLESYLRGEIRHGGWWWYYLFGLAVKTPIGTLALIATGGLALFTQRHANSTRARTVMLLTCPIVVLTFVSSQTGFNHHLRYVLPVLPFAFIAAGAVASGPFARRRALGICILLTATVVETMTSYPHCLSFFNVAVGGPLQGRFHLVDSNIDWGQDMIRLRDWSERHPEAQRFYLAAFGMFDPAILGVRYTVPSTAPVASVGELSDGWYVISVHRLQGMRRLLMPDGEGGLVVPEKYNCFQHLPPADRIGYSLLVYHIRDGRAVR